MISNSRDKIPTVWLKIVEVKLYVCITPSGMSYNTLKPDDIVVVDLNGVTIDAPSIETGLHCAEYKPCGSPELAEVTSECLESDDAVLLGNHGLLVVGDNIGTAYVNATIIEESAKVAFYAISLGDMKILNFKQCTIEREAAIAGYGQK